jgi:hypothetical protein
LPIAGIIQAAVSKSLNESANDGELSVDTPTIQSDNDARLLHFSSSRA